MTLADARAAAGRASDVLRLWCTDPDGHGTVDEDSYGNALLASAACFMRSHPEQAYVLMGAGGGGKSSFIKALMDHLDRRAMTFAPELLTQPTAMSAENAMLNLSSHLVAVSDDFTPGPKWQDILNMLKTLLTGLLPFSARRRGEDSVEGLRPLAVHIFTTNDHLPIGDSEAEQRRFAFAVFRNPEGYARFTDFSRDGAVFWPFMMASAMGWVRFAGRHHKGGQLDQRRGPLRRAGRGRAPRHPGRLRRARPGRAHRMEGHRTRPLQPPHRRRRRRPAHRHRVRAARRGQRAGGHMEGLPRRRRPPWTRAASPAT